MKPTINTDNQIESKGEKINWLMLIKRKREFLNINIKVDFRLRALPEIEMLQEGDRFQDPKLGSCLTLRNELSEETRADKARDFIGKGRPGESSSMRRPGEQLC